MLSASLRKASRAVASEARTSYAKSGLLVDFSRRQRVHLLVEIGFSLEPDARQVRHGDVAVLDTHAVREAAIGLEQVGIAFIAAKAEAGRDIERHLVAAVGNAAAWRPAVGLQHRQRALIFAQAIGQRA